MNKNWTTWQRACALAGVFLAAGWSFAARAANSCRRRQQLDAGRRGGGADRFFAATDRSSGRIRHPGAGTHCARHSGRDQRHGPLHGRHQPGQPAVGQRGAVRRPCAPGAEPQVRFGATRPSCRASRCSSCLSRSATAGPAAVSAARVCGKPQPSKPSPSGTWISAAAPTARAASSWPCRTTRLAWTSASRAKTWWSNSSSRRLPEGLRRRLDVTDFGTPVHSVTTFQAGDRVRMVIEPKGAWEHSAYQSDNQFVVEVRQHQGRSVQADPGARLRRREAVAELPEHRSAIAAAGDRRLHQLQHRDFRLRHRRGHAAPEGRALGPGAGHRPAGQGPGHAQDRQRAYGSLPRTRSRPRRSWTWSRAPRSRAWSRCARSPSS